MQLLLAPSPEAGNVILSYGSDSITWNVGIYDRTHIEREHPIFREVNGYWSTLPENRRRDIWGTYVQLKETLETAPTPAILITEMAAGLERLMALNPDHELTYWLTVHGNVRYPITFLDTHDPDDPCPDKTYTMPEYRGLVLLTTATRLLVPIWGEYIRLIKTDAGSLWKEANAMKITKRTWLAEHEATERLLRYVQAWFTSDVETASAIMAGISRAELPDWLLSMILIRRIAVGEIDASVENSHIVSNMHSFVRHTLRDLDRKFGGVRDKWPEDPTDEDGSDLEGFRVKQNITTGDVVAFNVFTENLGHMANNLDSTIPMEKVMLCYHATAKQLSMPVPKPHVKLIQWVLGKIIPPMAVPSLDKHSLLRAMAVTQAALWHWKFYDLAVLANAVENKPELRAMLPDARTHVPMPLLDQLNKLYPHMSQTENSSARRANLAYTAIAALSKEYADSQWKVEAPPALVEEAQGFVDGAGYVQGVVNLAISLSRLTIHLNQ